MAVELDSLHQNIYETFLLAFDKGNTVESDVAEAGRRYRQWSKILHPDKADPEVDAAAGGRFIMDECYKRLTHQMEVVKKRFLNKSSRTVEEEAYTAWTPPPPPGPPPGQGDAQGSSWGTGPTTSTFWRADETDTDIRRRLEQRYGADWMTTQRIERDTFDTSYPYKCQVCWKHGRPKMFDAMWRVEAHIQEESHQSRIDAPTDEEMRMKILEGWGPEWKEANRIRDATPQDIASRPGYEMRFYCFGCDMPLADHCEAHTHLWGKKHKEKMRKLDNVDAYYREQAAKKAEASGQGEATPKAPGQGDAASAEPNPWATMTDDDATQWLERELVKEFGNDWRASNGISYTPLGEEAKYRCLTCRESSPDSATWVTTCDQKDTCGALRA